MSCDVLGGAALAQVFLPCGVVPLPIATALVLVDHGLALLCRRFAPISGVHHLHADAHQPQQMHLLENLGGHLKEASEGTSVLLVQ